MSRNLYIPKFIPLTKKSHLFNDRGTFCTFVYSIHVNMIAVEKKVQNDPIRSGKTEKL